MEFPPFFHMKKRLQKFFFLSSFLGLHFGWPFLSLGWFLAGVCPRHWRFSSGLRGAHSPPGLYPLGGGVYYLAPEAPQNGECRRDRRYFWPCRSRVGLRPYNRGHLKKGLVAYSCVWWDALMNTEVSADALGRLYVAFLSGSCVTFSGPSYLWAVLPGVPRHWRFPPASGGHPPQAYTPFGGFITWRLRRP